MEPAASVYALIEEPFSRKISEMVEQQQPQSSQSVSSGSLRTKISLRGGYSAPLAQTGCSFYGMKPRLPPRADLLGSDDLIAQFDLSGAYRKFCNMNELSEDLASFLPHICGGGSLNARGDDSCSLRRLVEDPPKTRNEIRGLSHSAMMGFKLAPGPVPDSYRLFGSADGVLPPNPIPTSASPAKREYQEFGKNFNDAEEVKAKHRKKSKRSLDELEEANSSEKKSKRHRGGEEKEREKKQKKKKKEKRKRERRASDEESDAKRRRAPSPFY